MQTLRKFIDNPSDSKVNFELGLEYEKMNQTASAASFYLRAAEKTLDLKLQYAALLRNAVCFEKQGKRDLTVKTLLQRAIAICPNRPEGYFFLSKLYERRKEYHDCYMTACIGLDNLVKDCFVDSYLPEFLGEYGLLFQKAVSSWWVGLTEESREILFDLYFNFKMEEHYKEAVLYNLETLGYPKRKFIYTSSYYDSLIYKFPESRKIKNNYSQVCQDLFVLTVLEGKREGTYLEIGASDPFYNSNTALLEQEFNWKGVSVEILEEEVKKFKEQRKNLIICADAISLDYYDIFKQNDLPVLIDYLQVDCEPPQTSFVVLKRILETGVRFRVIQFEHDFYADQSVRKPSRQYLSNLGYELRVPNVAFNSRNAFEDWWVLTGKVNNCFSECKDRDINYVKDIFFKKC